MHLFQVQIGLRSIFGERVSNFARWSRMIPNLTSEILDVLILFERDYTYYGNAGNFDVLSLRIIASIGMCVHSLILPQIRSFKKAMVDDVVPTKDAWKKEAFKDVDFAELMNDTGW